MMLGLGETEDEIQSTLQDLLAVDCRILTLGQYLQPAPSRLRVIRYLPPEEFEAILGGDNRGMGRGRGRGRA